MAKNEISRRTFIKGLAAGAARSPPWASCRG